MLGQGKDMLMVLENDMMNLIDPLGQTLLHAQPIGSIRVWGVGRDNGRSVSRVQGQIYMIFSQLPELFFFFL